MLMLLGGLSSWDFLDFPEQRIGPKVGGVVSTNQEYLKKTPLKMTGDFLGT